MRIRLAIAFGLAACAVPSSSRSPTAPDLVAAPSETYAIPYPAFRATLGRVSITVDTEPTIATKSCENPERQNHCVRCELASDKDLAAIDSDFIDAIAIALAMYPPKLLAVAGIERVAVCRKIRRERESDNHPAGIADHAYHRLMVSIESFAGQTYRYADTSIESIVHHEVFHLLEGALESVTEERRDDKEWNGLNPLGFEYRDPAGDERPPGFVNAYATTNDREDRASVYETLVSHPEKLCAMAAKDPVVARKSATVWRRVATIVPEAPAFLRARAPCVDWVDNSGKPVIGPVQNKQKSKPSPRPIRATLPGKQPKRVDVRPRHRVSPARQ